MSTNKQLTLMYIKINIKMQIINNELSLLSEAKLKYLGKKIKIKAIGRRPEVETKITDVIFAPVKEGIVRSDFFKFLLDFVANGNNIDDSSNKSYEKLKLLHGELAMQIHFITDCKASSNCGWELYPHVICTEKELELLEC